MTNIWLHLLAGVFLLINNGCCDGMHYSKRSGVPPLRPLEVACVPYVRENTPYVHLSITNISSRKLFLPYSDGMPYSERISESSILLHTLIMPLKRYSSPSSVMPRPRSIPIVPGQVVNYEVRMVPFQSRDYWGQASDAVSFQGHISIKCKVGWRTSPIPSHPANWLEDFFDQQLEVESDSVEMYIP